MKLGKKEPRYDKRTLSFEKYRLDVPHPKSLNRHIKLDWGMLGNDMYGDCVFAGAAHETMLWNKEVGKIVEFSNSGVLGDYGIVTGFKIDNLMSDQGTVVLDALNYRRHTGISDTSFQQHTIGGYVQIEGFDALLEAVYLFGVVGIGFQFPSYAMDQFDSGKPWSVVHGGSIDGGHYVPVIGYTQRYVDVITWGRVQRMTRAFYNKFCDEAYAILSEEMLKDGRSIEGFDLVTLQNDLAAL